MRIIEKVSELLTFVENAKEKGCKTGLVPTMGALHEGHLSLVKRSRQDNDITMVSIFVNPTQFNDINDLKRYPRQPEQDFKLLAREGVDVVFAPTENEIYPDGVKQEKIYNLGQVAEIMEGKYRPGHFQGVAQIVDRLLCLCRPTRAYFGMKDFQQIAVIRKMIETEGLDVEIVPCPIVREANGLALSSRNALLSQKEREEAGLIHQILKDSVTLSKDKSVEEVKKYVISSLNAKDGYRVEYYEIIDARTLTPVDNWNESPYIMGCITLYVGNVRLIDNVEYKGYDN